MKKNNYIRIIIPLLGLLLLASACKRQHRDYTKVMHDPFLYEKTVHDLNYVVIHDIFTPPVASRVFAYCTLASYEALAGEGRHFRSLSGKIRGLTGMPAPDTAAGAIDFPFASLIALTEAGKNFIFSTDRVQHIIDSIKNLASNSGMPEDTYDNSIRYGEAVADSVISWSKKDNYAQVQGVQFTLSRLPGHWEPTPPGYFPAVQPMWATLRPM